MLNPYDELLYTGQPFPQTHPDRLATLARLFGMNPAPLDSCRVLELGCGDGSNLIPMAYALPGSEFVGVDLGQRGIELGCAMASAAGVRNVSLRCLDIRDAGPELGAFDYIVAHGVYSWVPPDVQDRLLAICGAHLNPQGIAYVSYSVYPGAHIRAMIAGMMQYHAARFSGPEQQVEQSRALLAFLAARPAEDVYALLLRTEAERMADRSGPSLYHDELGECCPLYFSEFIGRASGHGLKYLGEADFFEMQDASEPPEVAAPLRRMARDPIEKEQYLDFVRCRRFRQTLLCHRGVTLQRRIESAAMRAFCVARAHPPEGSLPKMPTRHPAAISAMDALNAAWPGALGFDELRARSGVGDPELLADLVLAFYASGLFQLHVQPPRFVASPGEFPRVSAVARFQAERGPVVTNLCHRTVRIDDEAGRRLLTSLDGTRSRAELAVDYPEAGLQSLAKLALLVE